MIGAAIRSHLAADAGVNALLGDRIYPMRVPQSPVFPCARYTVVSDVADRHHAGQTNLRKAIVQIDCFSTRYTQADQLAAAIETLLGGFKGTLGTGAEARTVQAIFSLGRNDAYDDEAGSDSDPEGVFGRSADYEIWYWSLELRTEDTAMAATAAKVGFGSTISYNSTGSTYTALGEVYELTPPSQTLEVVDATHHTSPDGYRERIPSVLSAGEATCTVVYDPDSTEYDAVVALLNGKTLKNWRITVPGSADVCQFAAYVTSVSPVTPREDKMTYAITLTITGKPDWVPAA